MTAGPPCPIDQLGIQIYADGADLEGIRRFAARPLVRGFTTNPTLVRQSGVADYAAFAREVVALVGGRPVSFEVFADDFDGMIRQGRAIGAWGPNVYVKIPVTNTAGEFAGPVIVALAGAGIKVNVTALFTLDQVLRVAECLEPEVPAVVSVFAGRIADTGRDPMPTMAAARALLSLRPRAELLWASTRELFNIYQAAAAGCHIITVTHGILQKLDHVGRDLDLFTRETVAMFHNDAVRAGYTIPEPS